ncbi:uncharacterized protein LOC119836119 isoform X2 [Zerene cesonia]|uniref:uncharacterized protein LOC119836119 isoform X2 n=1 Tax=Zerene cesonia TaxID=33412 RepID=UPI0018E4F2D0|nr:uncharacterized protein LOC119836119 isoform X2 [Zerene cesonia]
MTVIAVDDVPPKLTMKLFIRKLSWIVKGHFEALGFDSKNNTSKTCYLKLSPNLNVVEVIRRINETPSGKLRFKAYIPSSVPNFTGKPTTLSNKLRRVIKIPLELSPEQCFLKVHNEIITELVYKFTGLLRISQKTNHRLMENICFAVAERLRRVANSSKINNTPFKLSSAYRKAHPHVGDFQLISSTLHMLEDAQAQQRSQISEKDLTVVHVNPYAVVNNARLERVKDDTNKYSDRIIKRVTEYINKLNTESNPEQSEEEKARVNVRKQLKKVQPYLSVIIREVTGAQLIPLHKSNSNTKVNEFPGNYVKPMRPSLCKIYGEPYFPGREDIKLFLKKFAARSIHRADAMFNLLHVKVTRQAYNKMLAEDGVMIGGCKLIIRGSDFPTYKIPEEVIRQISHVPEPMRNDRHIVTENWEDW